MTTNLKTLLFAGGLLLTLLGCAGSPIKQTEGQTVYTQINIWVEDAEHLTTNYHTGWRLPVNSQVMILSTSSDAIDLQVVESGRKLTIANVPKYSGQDIAGIYQRYFAPTPLNLAGFSAVEAEAIRQGDIRNGISKQAMLVARGYPPAHATRSTTEDDWKYWINRFNTQIVSFSNGRVAAVKN